MTPEQIQRVIDAKRDIHPELAYPLRWDSLRRILSREGVLLVVEPFPQPAALVHFEGVWLIFIDKRAPTRRHTYYGAHELGHYWLHVQLRGEQWETCYNMTPHWPDDPREDDAELFAQMVLGLA